MGIIRANSHHFEWNVPVLIVGAGACGLTAAMAARGAGIDAMVLERDPTPSGSTGMSYGAICAAGSRLQAKAGIEDSPAKLHEDILSITRGQTDAELAQLIADNAGKTVDWLTREHRVALELEKNWTGLGHRHPRLHAPHNRSGETLMTMLLEACNVAGADVLTSAQVTSLIADKEDRVLGVQIRRPDGTEEELGCDALVLACCGFGGNPEWVRRYIPELADARYFGHEGNEGDGIRWGRALGGATADMGSYQSLGSLADPQSIVIPHTLLIGGGVQVNQLGQRFENELEDISGQALTILEQPGGICWMIYDQRLHAEAAETFQDYREAVSMKAIKSADDWASLAKLMHVPETNLEETMASLTRARQCGEADVYGRQFDAGQTLHPPYFALRVTGALFHTQGGLEVNSEAKVCRPDGSSLPNLFAGGGAARSVSGPSGWGYLPGMGLCTAVTLGRLAGHSAAKLAAPGTGQP